MPAKLGDTGSIICEAGVFTGIVSRVFTHPQDEAIQLIQLMTDVDDKLITFHPLRVEFVWVPDEPKPAEDGEKDEGYGEATGGV